MTVPTTCVASLSLALRSIRHVGHADIVRELIDGAAGLREANDNLPPVDQAWWDSYRNRVERVAQEASQS